MKQLFIIDYKMMVYTFIMYRMTMKGSDKNRDETVRKKTKPD